MRIARNVCWNPQNRAHFYETIDLRGHMPRFTLKMSIFPSISLETAYMCVETLRTGLVFLRQLYLRGHMPRFTLKMNIFSSISWELLEMCVETLRTGLVFPRWSIWGVTCLRFTLKMNVFPSISLCNTINVCWNPQNRSWFLWDNQFEGSHA